MIPYSMIWKWGGEMNSRCIYYVEGPCEEQLVNALKLMPSKLLPGKVKVYNPVQKLIPKSEMLGFKPGTVVTLVFDTDTPETKFLERNIELIKKYCSKVKVIFLAQVLNFEDELVSSTDVKRVTELTHSKSISNFKTDFCKMKTDACRAMLERHKIDVTVLWTTKASDNYSFISQNCEAVKVL